MKILFLADGPRGPLVTGDRLRNWRLVERLARLHQVEWWSIQEAGAGPGGDAPAGVATRDLIVPRGWEDRAARPWKWLRVPFSSEPLLMLAPPPKAAAREVSGALESFDVVHCSHLLCWRLLPARAHARAVVDLHDSMSLRYEAFLRHTPEVRLRDRSFLWYSWFGQAGRLRRYEREVSERAGAAVVVAERDRAWLDAPGMRVIPNGVDAAYFCPDGGPRVSGRLVFFGNLRYRPNADAACVLARELLPRIRAQVPHAHLHLVGVDPSEEVLSLGALPGVKVVGFVPDLRPELARAEVFACPLRVASGLQNKILEALAMGIPTVASPMAAQGLAIEPDVELLVREPGSGFVDAVVGLLQDAPARERLAQAGRRCVVERFSWDRAAGQLEQLYREVAQRAGRAA